MPKKIVTDPKTFHTVQCRKRCGRTVQASKKNYFYVCPVCHAKK